MDEKWTRVGRTNDALTFQYRRRRRCRSTTAAADASTTMCNSSLSTASSSLGSTTTETRRKNATETHWHKWNSIRRRRSSRCNRIRQLEREMNAETMEVMAKIREMNKMIRSKYDLHSRIGTRRAIYSSTTFIGSPTASESRKSRRKSSRSTDSSSSDRSKITFTTARSFNLVKPKRRNTLDEQCDHTGLPLSHPLATTPFPGKSSAAQRQRARELLISMGRQQMNSAADGGSESQSTTTTTEETSGEKEQIADARQLVEPAVFPNKCSPEIRQKARDCLRELATHKDAEKKTNCNYCGACKNCSKGCNAMQSKGVVVTDEDRRTFARTMSKLRKRIQNPESGRQRAVKSPFDITQSASENEAASTATNDATVDSVKS
ncbi:unnamed protein product [Caenorhabditis bovis]|uniref:Uncharacterized protein n=1 Tax=Caenorhabditis bovis TaxID=2654633 RepID=A0A8S1F658_9PELO|nr:unnamed protein product [Caenorhabditis bovis]